MNYYQTIKGKNLIAKMQRHKEEGETPFALSKSCTLELRRSFMQSIDPTRGGWGRYIPGIADWSISVSGLLSEYANELAGAFENGEEVTLRFSDAGETLVYRGKAFVESLTMTGSVREISSYQAKFKGNGPLSMERTNATSE